MYLYMLIIAIFISTAACEQPASHYYASEYNDDLLRAVQAVSLNGGGVIILDCKSYASPWSTRGLRLTESNIYISRLRTP